MTKFDKEYLELAKRILLEGKEVENRTGINTVKVPSHEFHFDLSEEFPVLQSKKMYFRKAILEMLWIWQLQSNDVRELHKRGVDRIWDEWMIDEDGIYRIYEPQTEEYNEELEVPVMDVYSIPISNPNAQMQPKLKPDGTIMTAKSLHPGRNIKAAKYFGKEYAHTIGTAYGFITNRYQHTQNLINMLKNNPNDRRMVKNLWQDEFLRTAVLPSCVWGTEWDVTDNRLNLTVLQRSCDVPLGLPFNVTQYATLLRLIAQVTNYEPGMMNYYIKDAHIYINQIEGIKEQIRRWDEYQRLLKLNPDSFIIEYKEAQQLIDFYYQKNFLPNAEIELAKKQLEIMDFLQNPSTPELWINPEITDFFAFDNSRELKDIKVKKYTHMGEIKFPLAQ